ncbi:MAG: purine-nucleoside phosphorylase [Alphaproteobacteria bacterium]|nr:purine-nucleoside phosphorylase [Alphaproteobacteria bacterium]MBQ8677762.1 purine-nucleoside phosphorylase [Alphaproteobacteria bacterium]
MIEEIASFIQNKIGNLHPDIGLILGSGLGDIAETIDSPIIIPYTEIPHFPKSTVSGHKGQLVIGKLYKRTILCMQGRFHLYEGYPPQIINTVIEVYKVMGIKELIITNAAGSLNPDFHPGSLMLISDHINLSGRNPLIGPNDDKYGPRFPSLANVYDKDLQTKIKEIAQKDNITLHQGTYMMVLGPNFETAAEIRAFRILGADAIGMSTMPEVICAARCGIKVLGISAITNFGTGMTNSITTHEETLEQGKKACRNLNLLIQSYMKEK